MIKKHLPNVPWLPLLIFILLSLFIAATGYQYYANEKAHIIKQKQDELSAVAELKIKQISWWLKERRGDMNVILSNPFLSRHVEQILKKSGDTLLKREILDFMAGLAKYYDYNSSYIFDAAGELILSYEEKPEKVDNKTRQLAKQVINSREVIFSNLQKDEESGYIYINYLIPLLIPDKSVSQFVGVLLLRIDPYEFLYPLIQSWPTPSQTSETLLVCKDGNDVLFLNELRHQKNSALSIRIPLSDIKVPAVMAVKGQEGIVEGIDYRGVPVVSALRAIPDSPWYLIAKVDQAEVYESIQKRAWWMSFIVIALIIATGATSGLLWRRSQYYSHLYEAELEKQALSQHYEYLTKYANDIILLTDQNLKIIEANQRAVESYGYTRDELLTINLRDLRLYDESLPGEEQINKYISEHNGLIFETVHKKKDGTNFPVEVSARVIQREGRVFYQSIIRDITERKHIEAERERLIEQIRAANQQLQELSKRIVEVQETERRNLARELHDKAGQNLAALGINLNFLQSQFLSNTSDKIEPLLKHSLKLLEETTENIRNVMSDLRPSVLDDYGLVAALRWYASRLSVPAGLSMEIKGEDAPRLPLIVETELFRIAQEALINSVKHAQANRITVIVKKEDHFVQLTIMDNGIGFSQQASTSIENRKGMGLETMAERAQAIGGSCRIESIPGHGTKVIIEARI